VIKNLITKEDLLTKSGPLATVVADDVVLGTNIRFAFDTNKGLMLQFGDKELAVTTEATHHICRQIKMPMEQISAIPHDLCVDILNFWYQQKMEGKKVRILSQETEVSAVSFSPRDSFIPLPHMIETAEEVLGKENIEGFHNPILRWDMSCVNVVLSRTFTPIKNDLLNVGIRIEHSLDEFVATRARAYIFRQICSNGAVTMDNIGSWNKRKKSDSLKSWLSSTFDEANNAFTLEESRLRKLTEIQTNGNTAKILNSILKTGGVSKKIREEVRTLAIDAQTQNLYDVYNLLTRTATHSELLKDNPSALALIDNVAADLSFHSDLCPVCSHTLEN
jgi:hypothetical protein